MHSRQTARSTRVRIPGRRLLWYVIRTLPHVLLCWYVAGTSGAANFEASRFGVQWELGAVQPGREVVVRDAIHLSVVSPEPWSLVVAGHLQSPGESAFVHSELSFVLRESRGQAGDAPLAHGSRRAAIDLGEQPATPEEGRRFTLDVALLPSWDDRAGEPIVAGLNLSVRSGGASSVSASAVEPNPLVEGFPGPVNFWYWLSGSAHEGEALRLTVERDGQVLATAEGTAGPQGWNVIQWTPEGPLTAGHYGYAITSGGGGLGARGTFAVRAAGAPGSEGGIGPLAHDGAEVNPAVGPGALSTSAGTPVVGLEVRLVAGDHPWRTWEVTLVNASPLSAIDTQVEICPPGGWSWRSADVLWKAPLGDPPAGDGVVMCYTALLGTVPGHSEKSFRFSLSPPLGAGGPGFPYAGYGGVQRPWMSIYVRTAPYPGGPGVVIHESRVPVDYNEFTVATTVRGRTFVDINGSGAWEEGEPVVPGVDIVVDGVRVAKSSATGVYSITLRDMPAVLWGRTPHGSGVPVALTGDWTALRPVVVDLPVPHPPARASSGSLSGAGGPSSAGVAEWFFEAGASGGAGNVQGGAGLRLFRAHGPWELDAGVQVDRRDVLSQAGPRPETAYTLDLGATFRSKSATVSAAWRSGLAENLRWRDLRPSKPAEEAWHAALIAEPRVVRLSPGLEAVAGASLTAGAASGDRWSCQAIGLSSDWSFGRLWFEGGVRYGLHTRLEAKGEKRDAYGSATARMRGVIDAAGGGWPYALDVSWGDKRTLAPSCGLTPKEGLHGSLRLEVPGEVAAAGGPGALVSAIQASAAFWPAGDLSDPDAEDPSETEGAPVPREQAFEIEVESVDLLPAGGAALKISPYMQWGSVPGGDLRRWVAFGIRSAGSVNGHRFALETGPKRIRDRRPSADDAVERAGRIAGAWTYAAGPVRPRIAFELSGAGGSDQDVQAGIAFDTSISPQRFPWIGSEVRLGMSVERRLTESSRKDEAQITVSRGGRSEPLDRLTLAWSAKVASPGLSYFGNWEAYDAAQYSVTLTRTLPQAAQSGGGEARSRAIRIESWRAQVRLAYDSDTAAFDRSVAAEGGGMLGSWLIELRRIEGFDKGSLVDSWIVRAAWSARAGRWGLGLDVYREQSGEAGAGGPRLRTAVSARAARDVTPAARVFVQAGATTVAGVSSDPVVPPGGAAGQVMESLSAAAGVTIETSKLGPGAPALLRSLPLAVTAGLEVPIGGGGLGKRGRYFVNLGLPLGLGPAILR